jgi:hypothetical protein
MNRFITVAALVAALTLTTVGCKQNKQSPHASQDHHPRPEGRIQIDQSAVLPVDVRAGVQREYPGASVQNVSKRTYDDRVVRYEVKLKTKDGRDVTRVFDADGKPYSQTPGK